MRKNSKPEKQFAVCITDTEPDLIPRKIYQVLQEESAAKSKYIRVVDESGEDYLYPASYFVFVELPHAAERAILMTPQ
jgi:hypothetical protein